MAGRSGGMEEQCSVCIVVSKRYSYVECFCGRDSTALGWRLAITLDFGSISVNGRIFLDARPSSFVFSTIFRPQTLPVPASVYYFCLDVKDEPYFNHRQRHGSYRKLWGFRGGHMHTLGSHSVHPV